MDPSQNNTEAALAALTVDSSGVITGVSQELCAAAGRSAAELIGTALADLFGPSLLSEAELLPGEIRSRARVEFLCHLSHQLRSPLNGIIGFAELMHDGKVGPVSAQHKEYLGDILTSARCLQRLIDDLLGLPKDGTGKPETSTPPRPASSSS